METIADTGAAGLLGQLEMRPPEEKFCRQLGLDKPPLRKDEANGLSFEYFLGHDQADGSLPLVVKSSPPQGENKWYLGIVSVKELATAQNQEQLYELLDSAATEVDAPRDIIPRLRGYFTYNHRQNLAKLRENSLIKPDRNWVDAAEVNWDEEADDSPE